MPLGMAMTRIHLCTGILEHAGRILLVASRYPNHTEPLWNLPGGRQEAGESFAEAVVREFREETSLTIRPLALAYVAESYDAKGATHFTNIAFHVEAHDFARRYFRFDDAGITIRFAD
jgi:ADP-ribose pyrophosphatase YjhB (NUDIX family)